MSSNGGVDISALKKLAADVVSGGVSPEQARRDLIEQAHPSVAGVRFTRKRDPQDAAFEVITIRSPLTPEQTDFECDFSGVEAAVHAAQFYVANARAVEQGMRAKKGE